ncbi:MAG TPA: hypothetical protein VF075_04510 [Pyrinomonadaceae bacterium]
MHKRNRFQKILGLLFVFIWAGISAHAKPTSHFKISIPTAGQIKVEAEKLSPARSWSFRNAYASALGIAERIDGFQAFGDSGQDARAKKSATGEYQSDLDATRISYTVKLSHVRPTDIPHVSWLAEDRGLLMLADLVPVGLGGLSVEFELPAGWSVESSITPDANGRYEVSLPDRAVFLVGRSLRKASKSVSGMMLETVFSGTWQFKDDDAFKAGTTVMEKYLALTGFRLPDKSVIMFVPTPVSLGNSIWKAETRGSTVVVLMDPAARVERWLGQVRVLLTHEMLHLWVPNALKLEGDYDWFFEGFTLYTALRTALELKIIDFKGYLTTLAGVYDTYISHPDTRSLIDESERRWSSEGTQVYVKGMLVAFLYDLMVRKASSGKTTLADSYKELFGGHVADGADGNEAIIRLLGSSPAGNEFTKSYIETNKEIRLEQLLPAYGLQLDASGKSSQLRVSSGLSEDQKQLLRSLGYRN